jgi:hypothetical protein
MLRLTCILLTIVGIQFIQSKMHAAAPEPAAKHIRLDSPAFSLIEKATGGISRFNDLLLPVPVPAQETPEASNPIVWVRMSRDFLAKYVEREVDREKPAHDRVLGITFVGESRTTGNTRLVLHPNADGALGEVIFEGNIQSQTSGRKGPVTLHYVADSKIRATKRIVIGHRGLETRPATAQTPTRLTLTDVDSSLPGLRGRIAERIARRRAASSWSQANSIVSDHRAHDVRKGIDERLNERVAELQSQVASQIATLKVDREDSPAMMHSRSTSQFVEVALFQGGSDIRRLAMPEFQVDGDPDIASRVHRSMLPQIVANAALQARLAPLVARALQSKLVAGDETSGSAVLNMSHSLQTDWLSFDIVDAYAPTTAQRIAAEESVKTVR